MKMCLGDILARPGHLLKAANTSALKQLARDNFYLFSRASLAILNNPVSKIEITSILGLFSDPSGLGDCIFCLLSYLLSEFGYVAGVGRPPKGLEVLTRADVLARRKLTSR